MGIRQDGQGSFSSGGIAVLHLALGNIELPIQWLTETFFSNIKSDQNVKLFISICYLSLRIHRALPSHTL